MQHENTAQCSATAAIRFDTILVANRGEIAVRIFRTARALGFRTVAVYSEADAGLPHALAADLAVCIGPAAAADSYLNIANLIQAAKRTGAHAIHPGYGFLSESEEFAAACKAAGLVYIGPSPEAIRVMGNKAMAKNIMTESGVPCIPGYDGAKQDDQVLIREAQRIGFPIMVKAMAGGGGKGMRLVDSAAQLKEALSGARSEAQKSFGNGALILEKAVVNCRHIEVQVFGDGWGNIIYLGDRDCSIQRRHQKVIEEAPAPNLPQDLRERMGRAAVQAAKAVDYEGAGTVEFLVVPGGDFFFLEMNTRLQVEHPVTEMVTGLDLVEWQIKVASGQRLPLTQDQVRLSGHAIEVRVYAEDPAAHFLPQSGQLSIWQPPQDTGIRVDHGLCEGAKVSTHYDPMIAKVIATGENRNVARMRATRALENFAIGGVRNNLSFLKQCLQHPVFADARFDTGFLDRHALDLSLAVPDRQMVAVAAALFHGRTVNSIDASLANWHSRPWKAQRLALASDDWIGEVFLSGSAPGAINVRDDVGAQEVILLSVGPAQRVSVDSVEYMVRYAWEGDNLHLVRNELYFSFSESHGAAAVKVAEGSAVIKAPMPGTIAEVRVAVGEFLTAGQVLAILEAMKMELQIQAPVSGRLAKLEVIAGQQVGIRQTLMEIVAVTGEERDVDAA